MNANSEKRQFSLQGALLVVVAAMLWGTTGTTQALAPEAAQPEVLGAIRLIFGGLFLLTVAFSRGVLTRSLRLPILPTIIAVVTIAAYQPFFFAGVGRTGVAVGTIVGIGSAPIIAGLLDIIVERRRPSERWLVATGVALLGCVLLLLPGNSVTVDPVGVFLAMGAGASYAIYTLASKHILADNDPDAVMAVIFGLGGLVLLPVMFINDLSWLVTAGGVLVAFHLGVIATGLSYTLFGRGLKGVEASTAVTLTLAEPLTAGTLGIMLVGERLTFIGMVGVFLLFLGLAILTIRQS